MAASPPYIPSKDDELDSWATNFDAIVAVDYASLGITMGEAAAVTAATAAYTSALAAAITPGTRTPVTVAAKNVAKADLLATDRPLAQRVAINPNISPEDKVDLGLNPHTSTPTPVAPPETVPVLSIVGTLPAILKIEYYDEETPTSKAKPYGVVALEMWYAAGEAPVMDPEGAIYWGPVTKSPTPLDFPTNLAGQTITLFGRWVNRNRGVGPWSSGVSMILPL